MIAGQSGGMSHYRVHFLTNKLNSMEQQVVANELNNQSLTFGQKLVDVNFNPSGNPTIDEVKQLCARLADIVWENSKGRDVSEPY